MKIKTYIALTFIVIFMVKFISVDANGLNMIFGSSDTVFVNLHCKKNNSDKKSGENFLYQNDTTSLQVFSLNANCTTPFHFHVFSWETNDSELIVDRDDHFTTTLSYRFLESVSPPPRLG